jgi:NAD+ synthase
MQQDELGKVYGYIVRWIRDFFKKSNGMTAVIGMSGGADSTVAAKLLVDALGPEDVIGVFMPCGYQPDIQDAYDAAAAAGITRTYEIDIGETNAHMARIIPGFANSEQAKLNLRPRLRMATLYAVAQSVDDDGNPVNGRVCCTGNRCEALVGYCTLWGDLAGDFAPLAILTKSEVCELGRFMGLPDNLVDKVPSDGLSGKTDEESLGVTYAQIEAYLACRPLDPEVAGRISRMAGRNQFKREIVHIPHP